MPATSSRSDQDRAGPSGFGMRRTLVGLKPDPHSPTHTPQGVSASAFSSSFAGSSRSLRSSPSHSDRADAI